MHSSRPLQNNAVILMAVHLVPHLSQGALARSTSCRPVSTKACSTCGLDVASAQQDCEWGVILRNVMYAMPLPFRRGFLLPQSVRLALSGLGFLLPFLRYPLSSFTPISFESSQPNKAKCIEIVQDSCSLRIPCRLVTCPAAFVLDPVRDC